jgi:2-iminobutanoate/2-iminopropanoate deaminase
MQRTVVHTDRAPRPIGPYCQAVLERRHGTATLWCAGQIALDPETMEIVPGDAGAHTERVMRNVGAVLEAAGMGFSDVVRSTIYVTALADLPAVNQAYGACFTGTAPPRSTVQVAGLPRGSLVEIEVLAVAPARPGRRRRPGSVRSRSRGAVGGSTGR